MGVHHGFLQNTRSVTPGVIGVNAVDNSARPPTRGELAQTSGNTDPHAPPGGPPTPLSTGLSTAILTLGAETRPSGPPRDPSQVVGSSPVQWPATVSPVFPPGRLPDCQRVASSPRTLERRQPWWLHSQPPLITGLVGDNVAGPQFPGKDVKDALLGHG